MSMLECINTINSLGVPHNDYAVIIGGGAKSNIWRQMIADALGLKLVEMKYADSSFGSAMLAGIAVGIFENAEKAIEICNEIMSETIPNSDNTSKYKEVFKKYKAIQKALEPIYNSK